MKHSWSGTFDRGTQSMRNIVTIICCYFPASLFPRYASWDMIYQNHSFDIQPFLINKFKLLAFFLDDLWAEIEDYSHLTPIATLSGHEGVVTTMQVPSCQTKTMDFFFHFVFILP
jgi:hypothetical protein